MERYLIAFGSGFVPMFGVLGYMYWLLKREKQKTKAPFTSLLLRPPGESLRLKIEQLDDAILDKILLILGGSLMMAIGGWFWKQNALGSSPFYVIGLIMFVCGIRAFWKSTKLRRDYYLGFMGERAVGEELNQLLAHGWSVFHDVEFNDNPSGKPFNVDHVVAGTGGIYAIETKTRRKRAEGKNEVIFNGSTLTFPWGTEDFGLRHADDRAAHLSRWLEKSLQQPCPVIPILVLPGWKVERKGKGSVNVLSGKELLSYFRGEHRKPRLDPATAKGVIALLEQRCRDVRY